MARSSYFWWMAIFISGLALKVLVPESVYGDDWPEWRGPNRDNVWAEQGIVESFPSGGLPVRWRLPIGMAWSSPAVAKGRVYVMDAEIVRPKCRERVHCVDAATGKPIWTHVYDAAYPAWIFNPGPARGPTATPLVRDGKVYTLGAADLFCLDAATGAVLWKKDLMQEYQIAQFSTDASPLIEGDLLIIYIGAKPGPCLIALDRNSGREVWKALDEGATPSSPILVTAGGARQLIAWTPDSVTSLTPATGVRYWRERFPSRRDSVVATPVYHDDQLFVGGLMLKLDSTRPAASVLWPRAAPKVLSDTSTALFRDHYLYSAKSSGEFVCLDAETGKQLWETNTITGLNSGAAIHQIVNGGGLLLFTDQGNLIRARVSPQGYQELSRVKLIEPTYPFGGRNVAWPPPAFANGAVFVRNDKELICVSMTTQSGGGR